MQRSPPWKSNKPSAHQEIPSILCNPKVYYHIHHKSLPPVPILSQIHPIQALQTRYLQIHFNVVLHLLLCLPCSPFPSSLFTRILYAPLLAPIHATCLSHLIIFYLITRKTFGDAYRSWRSPLRSLLHSLATLSLSRSYIFLSTFSRTHLAYILPSVREIKVQTQQSCSRPY